MDAALATEPRTGIRPTFASSKYSIPEPVMSWVPRPSLIERLDSGVAAPLTLVVGSPGSGKTSLLAQWAHSQPPGAVCWVNCDQADLDPVRFWQALIGAADRVQPGFASECLDLLALNDHVDHDLLECLLAVCESLREPLSVVVDDFHAAGPAVHDDVRFLVSRGFGRLRLLLGSRSEPAVGLDRLRLAGRLCEVRDAELRFSATEAASLFERLQVDVDAGELGIVVDRTEGWAAGVQLAGVAMRDVDRRDDFVARLDRSKEVIGHYLWSEVFEAQEAAVKRFLLDTSIADELSPGLAAALSPGTPVTLLDVEAANLLLVRLDAGGDTFRYHHLFAEMLRYRLRSTAPDHELVLHERAAGWHGEHGDAAAAFRHRWRAGQRTAAITTMHGTVLDAYVDDLLPSLEDGDRSLTDDDLIAAPGPAISYCAALAMRGFVEDAERVVSRLEAVAGAMLTPQDRRQLHSVAAICSLSLGATGATIRHGNAVLALHEDDVADDWLALGLTVLARAQAWEGDHEAATAALSSLRLDPLSRTSQIELAGSVAFCRLMSGELREAIAVADGLLDQLQREGLAEADVVLHPTGISGTVQLERGQLAEAERALRRVGDADSQLRRPVRLFAKLGLSRIWRADGNFDAAFAAIDEAYQILRRRSAASGMVDHLRARHALLQIESGDIESATPLIGSIGTEFTRSLLLGRQAIAGGNLDVARSELEQASASARSRRHVLEAGLARLSLAVAAGEPVDDIAADVFEVASVEGFVFPIAEAGSAALDAVRQVARTRPASAYVDALMSIRPSPPASSAARPAQPFEVLSERERTVLAYLATSMTYNEIASTLYVSVNTIKTHTKNITRKLQATSRAETLARARELRYL